MGKGGGYVFLSSYRGENNNNDNVLIKSKPFSQSVIVPERSNPALGVGQICDSPTLLNRGKYLLMNPPRHALEEMQLRMLPHQTA